MSAERTFGGFDRVAIWGLGLMGGSLAAALKTRGFAGRVVGISRVPSIERALAEGFVDEAYPHEEFAAGLAGADLVVFASPIGSIIRNLEQAAGHLASAAIVTDVGSTKVAITQAAERALPEGVTFIGSHPMTGSEATGIGAADAWLYENAVWVLAPGEDIPGERVARLAAFAEGVGAKTVRTDPATHDRIAARISHVPQTVAVTLMNQAGAWNDEEDLTLRLAAGGFRDLTRIASSPWAMWSDIYATNGEAILDALDDLIASLQDVRENVATVASGGLEEAFEASNRLRLSVPRDTRGFVRPLTDIMVVVHDEPGVLARIAGCLAPHEINIRDIEVLKVREGEGGTMRLAFDGPDDAREAVRLLTGEGLKSWVRD